MSFISSPRRLNTTPWKNLKIGVFGGTFNPPHAGHVHVCEVALKTGRFDFIWWMVTPQNPLKVNQASTTFEQRFQWSKEINQHPKIIVSDIERQLGTYKSIDTVRALRENFPKTDFTFIAGTDNAMHLHKWEEWRKLTKEIKFLFIARPPALNLVKNYPAKHYNAPNTDWILQTKLINQSSTALRCI